MSETFDAMSISNLKPIRDIVYENLKRAIVEGDLQPGERIVEKEYAEKMNISRTPVREALRKLEIEGLVQYIPRKGVVVNGFKNEDIIEIYAIRKALESLAIRYAIEKITDEDIEKLKSIIEDMEKENQQGNIKQVLETCKHFNEVILRASMMPRLMGMIHTLQEYVERFRRITMANPKRRELAIKEHKEILKAVMGKDYEKAESLIYRHLEASQKVFFDK